jgi:hypothetical protein
VQWTLLLGADIMGNVHAESGGDEMVDVRKDLGKVGYWSKVARTSSASCQIADFVNSIVLSSG